MKQFEKNLDLLIDQEKYFLDQAYGDWLSDNSHKLC